MGDMAMVGREAAKEMGLWQREHLALPLERGGNVQRWDPLLILLSDLGPAHPHLHRQVLQDQPEGVRGHGGEGRDNHCHPMLSPHHPSPVLGAGQYQERAAEQGH